MKIYLAHNYAARGWLQQVVPMFEVAGHEITSRWLYSVKNVDKDDAEMDLEDIFNSDALILFTEQFGETPGKGKFVELGYATGLQQFSPAGYKVVLIGKDTSCVFFALADKQVDTIEEAIEYLAKL